jgi:hypothetical protein
MSTILVDNLTGKTSAGDITVTSEGGAATQSLQQGLAKAWVNFNGTGTIAARDSLNLSSLTDAGGGNYGITVSNAFGNSDYAATGMSQDTASGDFISSNPSVAPTTTVFRFYNFTSASSVVDTARVFVTYHGDLA